MRRASVLVAVTAVSLVIVSACTSFPDLTAADDDEGTDGSPGGNGGDGGGGGQGGEGGGGGGNDGSSSTTGDGGSTATDSSVADGATAKKDAAGGVDAAAPDAEPASCMQGVVDCNDASTSICPQCSACTTVTNGMLPCAQSCCAVETGEGNSSVYKPCCYYAGVVGQGCKNPGKSVGVNSCVE